MNVLTPEKEQEIDATHQGACWTMRWSLREDSPDPAPEEAVTDLYA